MVVDGAGVVVDGAGVVVAVVGWVAVSVGWVAVSVVEVGSALATGVSRAAEARAVAAAVAVIFLDSFMFFSCVLVCSQTIWLRGETSDILKLISAFWFVSVRNYKNACPGHLLGTY